MSTSYYRLREPITHLRLDEGPTHDRLTVWEHHARAGVLTLSKGWGRSVAYMLAETDVDDVHCAMFVHAGPSGVCITENLGDLTPDEVLISESMELVTVAKVRAQAGRGRKLPSGEVVT